MSAAAGSNQLSPPSASGDTALNSGWQLYERARQLIPGGTNLLSKRPEMFLPGGWPCYYRKAQGCQIWDLDGRRLIDMTTTGIGKGPGSLPKVQSKHAWFAGAALFPQVDDPSA